jgi:cysteinyl-tRNA synthetase
MSRWPKKKVHFKKDTYSGMRWNLGDFIIWHACEEGEKVCFDQELGSGRPSWNVQDPAMATKYLGYKIDIHCGGIDNLYRHHDYTLAVVEGVSGKTFSNFWLHGEHLLLNGKKMSKSKGNVVYTEDLLNKRYSPEHIRFYLIYGHYRKKMNLTDGNFKKAAKKLDDFKEMMQGLMTSKGVRKSDNEVKDLISQLIHNFEGSMNDDLDVKGVFDDLYDAISLLLDYKNQGKLSDKDCRNIQKEIGRIDSVLNVRLL